MLHQCGCNAFDRRPVLDDGYARLRPQAGLMAVEDIIANIRGAGQSEPSEASRCALAINTLANVGRAKNDPLSFGAGVERDAKRFNNRTFGAVATFPMKARIEHDAMAKLIRCFAFDRDFATRHTKSATDNCMAGLVDCGLQIPISHFRRCRHRLWQPS
ncbi:hypothetical protein MesoLj113a_38300 [Mesorhizobium sp. 113-1-2]|nr:hypothetical protein MesoLj113a_38300 [Mesorhizobium sp. 113-1-2]